MTANVCAKAPTIGQARPAPPGQAVRVSEGVRHADDRCAGDRVRPRGRPRAHFERLPSALDWRPHDKSFTVSGLASHIVDCVGWVDSIFRKDAFVDPADQHIAPSVDDLLNTFDQKVAEGKQALAG
jgi:hypothetical protein